MQQLDIHTIRTDFPILSTKVYNKPLIYFDNAATTQKPRQVLDKIMESYTQFNSNIHRGVHYLSQKSTQAHEEARQFIARYINAKSVEEIIFTRGTTEAINLLASSFGEQFCDENDEIIISAMEHHANIVPWQMLCEKKGMKLKVLPITDNGELVLDKLQELVTEKTKLVSIMHISNVLGTVNPVKEIIAQLHEQNIPVLIDGAQAIPHTQVDMQELDADFYVFSGHKVYAPTGIGILYAKKEWLEKLPPYHGGGEMIKKVTFEKTTYNDLPFKFEAGTPDYVGSVALAEALKYIQNIGIENISRYETDLTRYATERLLQIEGLRIYGTAEKKSSVISFLVDDIHPYDMGMLLDKMGIAVRTGQHCAEPLMDRLGITGAVRASFSFYNTQEEIDVFIASLQRAIKMLS